MIYSATSNIVMSVKIMEALGLQVDTKQGRWCALDAREVPIIGTINALPYRLAPYFDTNLKMRVLEVDILARYGMLFLSKWSAPMGSSLQCDLTIDISTPLFQNFHLTINHAKLGSILNSYFQRQKSNLVKLKTPQRTRNHILHNEFLPTEMIFYLMKGG